MPPKTPASAEWPAHLCGLPTMLARAPARRAVCTLSRHGMSAGCGAVRAILCPLMGPCTWADADQSTRISGRISGVSAGGGMVIASEPRKGVPAGFGVRPRCRFAPHTRSKLGRSRVACSPLHRAGGRLRARMSRASRAEQRLRGRQSPRIGRPPHGDSKPSTRGLTAAGGARSPEDPPERCITSRESTGSRTLG